MNRTLLLAAAALAVACGDVEDRADCRTSAGCPTGEFCAHTSEGSVCWPDPVAPAVGDVTIACATATAAGDCPRDGALVVTAVASDDQEVLSVEATLDLAPGRVFPLVRADGGGWRGEVALGSIGFPWFAREAVVTVRVFDGARNEVSVEAADRPRVTRLRWEYSAGAALTPPAVMPDGAVIVARNALSDQLVAVDPDGTTAWSRSLGTGAVTAAPSIGAQAIWVGANDGKLYAVELDGSAVVAGRSCTASGGGSAKGPPAVTSSAAVDLVFGAFGAASTGRIVASAPSGCGQTPERDSFTAGAAIPETGGVVGATASSGNATLRRFSWDGAAFEELWTSPLGTTVSATPGFDLTGRVLTGGLDAELDLTTPAGVTASLATLDGSIEESPIVLADGDVVVGDASGRLHRIRPDGSAAWPAVDLGAAVHAPMALTDATGLVRWFLVATSDGKVHALDDGGLLMWEGDLTGGQPLGAGNLHTPGVGDSSTAYFAGADGKLYALVVDGRLDTASPWPKAWHDARNTSRAGGEF